MNLSSTSQIDENSIQKIEFDAFICCSGFEARSTYIADNFNISSLRKIAIFFQNYTDEIQRIKNDKFFKEKDYEVHYAEGDTSIVIKQLLIEILNSNNEVNLLIDYSSMTRVWYSAILSLVNFKQFNKIVNLYFVYSFAKFTSPQFDPVRNIHIGPIEDFTALSIPDKPTALIIGLGYEKERAFGLTEYLDAETYIFYNDNTNGAEYNNIVKEKNKELISQIKEENVFEYPILELDYSESLLLSVCKNLNDDFRLIIAPTGPKPFTLISLIVAIRLKNVDVWRISAGKSSNPTNRFPDGRISCYRVAFN